MWRFWRKCSLVMAGGSIQGFGMGMFLFPHAVPSGGAGGLAVLLNHFFYINIGLALWLVNFSMLMLAMKYLGNRATLWTMMSMTVTSFAIFAFQATFLIPKGNVWVDLFLGSVFLGAGVGLLLREGVSNGGVGVIALIISNTRSILPGKPLFFINGCIFILTASIIKWEIIVQAVISQWISTIIVDFICKVGFYQSYSIGWRKK
ncbi:YitT family protein [Bacillus sp. V5-8f]|uniref:YitT family protein n=1 Tax=Bacillus sp. V5-8f TaxID=2053044 RepID=UPI000C785397|nr:YitT family protein [Bacillus sp. V5-8f]PLT33668.1 membrane protein [Bacillus sp. V5-8f]